MILAGAGAAGAFVLAAVNGLSGRLPVWSPLVLGLAALPAGREFGRMVRRGFGHDTKGPSMEGISRIFLLFTAATAVSLAGGILIEI